MKGIKFRIDDETYFYDTPTNKMFRLPDAGCTRDKGFVDYIRENHNLLSDQPFQAFSFGRVDEAVFKGVSHIVINMTNQCNFRCTYCKYSGDYEDVPAHHDIKITSELLDDVVAFMQTLDIGEHFRIGFYGGEPLMEYEKIRRFVENLKATFPRTEFTFSMTTNGSYLGRERVCRFLIDHGFYTNISMDGPKQSMKYRIFLNGKPTYDFVYKNLCKFKAMDPDYFMRRVGYSVVFAPPVDLEAIIGFFTGDDVYTRGPMFFSGVDAGSNFDRDHNDSEARNRLRTQFAAYKQQYLDMLAARGTENKLFHVLDSLFGRDVAQMHSRPYNDGPVDEIYPVGNCMPIYHKLFINSEGKFYMCEKESVFHALGDVKNGVNVARIKELMAEFLETITEHGCLECPFSRICKLCMAQIATADGFSKEDLVTFCKRQKKVNLNNVKFYMEAIQANADYFSVQPQPVSV